MVDLFVQNPMLLMALTGSFFLALIVMLFLPSQKGSEFENRLKRVSHGPSKAKAQAVHSHAIDIRLYRDDGGLGHFFSKIIPQSDILQHRLMRTGKNITVSRYGLYVLAASLIFLLIIGTKFSFPLAVSIIAAFVMGWKAVDMAIAYLIHRREKNFIKNFADAIDLMVRGIKSGLPISQTIFSIAEELDGPVAEEFEKVSASIRLGTDMIDALWDRARKVDIAEFKFFCVALSIQKETGGNLSETLTNLSTILRRRKQMQLKIKAMSSEAKASAIIIGSLPFIMYVILKLMNPGYVDVLLDDPRGIKLVFLGLFMIALGAGVMNKLVRFDI